MGFWRDIWRRWRGADGRAGDTTRVWRGDDGEWRVDVRGQTCPGYLLQIDNAVAGIGPRQRIRLIISYPPCADDVRVWCARKGHTLHDVEHTTAGHFEIVITSG